MFDVGGDGGALVGGGAVAALLPAVGVELVGGVERGQDLAFEVGHGAVKCVAFEGCPSDALLALVGVVARLADGERHLAQRGVAELEQHHVAEHLRVLLGLVHDLGAGLEVEAHRLGDDFGGVAAAGHWERLDLEADNIDVAGEREVAKGVCQLGLDL